MDHVAFVQILQGQRDLGDVVGRAVVGKFGFLAQNLEQLALGGVLEDEVHALGVVKVPVHAQHVRVAQV